jgi:hypothetical protein
VRLEGLGKLKKSNDLIGNRTRDLLACSIMPQPTTIPRAPFSQKVRRRGTHTFLNSCTYLFIYYVIVGGGLLLLFFIIICFVRLLTLRPLWPIVPASGDNDDDCGEADGM